ncbi:MAG: YceI family protein [Bryobacteraceae bacterium]|jgi:polyisoprenoid-binding protein YceI
MTKPLHSYRWQLPLFAVLFAGSLAAQETAWQLDAAQTKVEYTLGDVLHTVHGAFTIKRGDLRFDPESGKASGDMVVDAKSGNSGNSTRDRKMNREILESDKYSEIVFRPDRIQGKVSPQGVSQVEVHGTFEIHGAGHEITMSMQVEPVNGEFKAATQFNVPYQKWGMKNPSTLFLRVDDKVAITIHAVWKPVR